MDAPWYEQYGRYLRSLARLDFGATSTFPGRSVNSILKEQGPITLELVVLALFWVVVLGVPLGIAAAVWRGRALDRATTVATALMSAVPIFFVATVLIWLLAVKLGLLPTSGLARLALVAAAVARAGLAAAGASGAGAAVRDARGRRPRARPGRPRQGPAPRTGGRRARAAPRLGAGALDGRPLLGQLVLGLFLVEWIFSIPGIGRYFIAAAQARDYPLTLGLTVVLTTAVLVVNLLSDIALAAIDPRVREASVSGAR